MNYHEFKEKSGDLSNFKGLFFAFNNDQLDEGMKKIGLDPSETSKICSIGAGGYILKTEVKKLIKFFENRDKVFWEHMKDPEFAFSAFNYELGNHEYVITCDPTDALDALGLTIEEVYNNPMYKEQLLKAVKYQKENSWS